MHARILGPAVAATLMALTLRVVSDPLPGSKGATVTIKIRKGTKPVKTPSPCTPPTWPATCRPRPATTR